MIFGSLRTTHSVDMALKELLLGAILQWSPPWYPPGENPETPVQYEARLATIAEAVALEAEAMPWRLGSPALAAATLTIWYGESRFTYDVHVLGRSRWGQDLGQARCMGQVHATKLVPSEEWGRLVGGHLSATRRCARATMRVLTAMARMCSINSLDPEQIAVMFGAYGSGKGCRASQQSRSRALRWQWLMERIETPDLPFSMPAFVARR